MLYDDPRYQISRERTEPIDSRTLGNLWWTNDINTIGHVAKNRNPTYEQFFQYAVPGAALVSGAMTAGTGGTASFPAAALLFGSKALSAMETAANKVGEEKIALYNKLKDENRLTQKAFDEEWGNPYAAITAATLLDIAGNWGMKPWKAGILLGKGTALRNAIKVKQLDFLTKKSIGETVENQVTNAF
jgi:hypothetical protein